MSLFRMGGRAGIIFPARGQTKDQPRGPKARGRCFVCPEGWENYSLPERPCGTGIPIWVSMRTICHVSGQEYIPSPSCVGPGMYSSPDTCVGQGIHSQPIMCWARNTFPARHVLGQEYIPSPTPVPLIRTFWMKSNFSGKIRKKYRKNPGKSGNCRKFPEKIRENGINVQNDQKTEKAGILFLARQTHREAIQE